MNLKVPKHLSKEETELWNKLVYYYDNSLEKLPSYYELFLCFLLEESGTMLRECYGDIIIHECPYGHDNPYDSEEYGLEVIKEVLRILDEGGVLLD